MVASDRPAGTPVITTPPLVKHRLKIERYLMSLSASYRRISCLVEWFKIYHAFFTMSPPLRHDIAAITPPQNYFVGFVNNYITFLDYILSVTVCVTCYVLLHLYSCIAQLLLVTARK